MDAKPGIGITLTMEESADQTTWATVAPQRMETVESTGEEFVTMKLKDGPWFRLRLRANPPR